MTSEHSHGASADLVNIGDYEEGRAEALGALCSIFTSQQCGEPFLPVYLGRFYHALTVGLQFNEAVRGSVNNSFQNVLYLLHTQSTCMTS